MRLLNKKNAVILLCLFAVYGIVEYLFVTQSLNQFYMMTLILVCIYIILAVSQNLITGFTGQLAIGHAGFMAIGAYMSAMVVVKFQGSMLVGIIFGAVLAGLAGMLIGIPTLRLRGDYLAIATLGFGEIVRITFLNVDYLGGATGFSVPKTIDWTWAFWLMVLSVVVISNFINSSHGRACISVRENEIAAEAMGINTTKYKVMAFTIGAMFAGLAGGIYANYMYFIQPTTFNFWKSFEILAMVVLGGLGSTTGAIVGAMIMTIGSALLAGYPEFRMLIIAVLLIILMIFRPNGLMGNKELKFNFLNFKKKGDENGTT
ncbi:ABC transporter [Desulfuribacillus stibiiarsenatis]|uniref:ABC transporter n=1 Tax=Desulfuribacillus stibiiarsenatis TaxID=1390249 RepID=A0A1E5L4J9_9FIRM|nr:branched-chain amino acid ABC transporter permease [Desulfuribacillus stibiiarsenatis]OEH85021.1 ABC transporter [Desulfuribacillus stibiiarsenatis]